MDLMLSKGEQIVKEFQYGEKKQKGLFAGKKNNVKRSLIVTNKRIVSQSQGQNTTARKEIPLSAADYVTSSFTKHQFSIVPAIILAIFGLAALIAGLVMSNQKPSGGSSSSSDMTNQIIGFILLGLGGLFLILAIILLFVFLFNRSAGVEIIIAGKCLETQLLDVASSNLKPSKKAKLFKIIVKKEIAFPMINELGALLLDLKAGNLPQAAPKQVAKEEPAAEPAK